MHSVCYFPQLGGPARAHFREEWARPLAQMEEPSHCRRLAAATRGIRSLAVHRRPSRNQCHWRITRTSTNQFPVSWNSGGGLGEGWRTRATQWCTWHVEWGDSGLVCWPVQPVMDQVVFIPVRDDKGLPFSPDLSAPQKHEQTWGEDWEKRRSEKVYTALTVFSN